MPVPRKAVPGARGEALPTTGRDVALKKNLATLSAGALYLMLAGVATYPLALRAADHVFGPGTPPLNIWAMAWVNHQLFRDPFRLFDGNCFYPYARSLAFSEHLFVPAIAAGPVLALTGNPVLAHNAVSFLTLALAGLGMYLLCRELTGDAIPSFAGGLLYACTPQGLAIVDVDQFATVNDILGQRYGDALLKATGNRLREVFPGPEGFVARLAGA